MNMIIRRGGQEIRGQARLSLITKVMTGAAWLSVAGASGAQSEPLPILHHTRTAGTAQDSAFFGYSAVAAKIEGSEDQRDDAVICAINEDVGTVSRAGAAYVFLNANFDPPLEINKQRLTPLNPTTDQQLGRLSIVVGNLRGPDDPPLILIGAAQGTATYCGGTVPVVGAGTVEVYDFNDASFAGLPALSLQPPPNLDAGPHCGDQVPAEVRLFGHGLVLLDITRDGITDALIGAPGTDVGSEADLGRIYVFAGHEDFLVDPYASWIGLNAPESCDPLANSGGLFGNSLAVASLSQSSIEEVVVGRPDRFDDAEAGQPEGGTAVILRGQYLHDLFSEAPDVVSDPVCLEERDEDVPEYQVLANPFSGYQDFGTGRDALWNDWFGWFVFSVGDVGSPSGSFDGIDDVIVHAEATDYLGNGCGGAIPCNTPQVQRAGADFAYYGTGQPSGVDMANPAHVLLMRPSSAGLPQFNARFGRATTRLEWVNFLTEEDDVQPALVLGQPDASVGPVGHAGRAYLVRLPLPQQPINGWEPAPIANAWGTPLVEPGGVGTDHLFGAWAVALDHVGDPNAQPGQQLLISARQATVTVGATSHPGAGKVYTFTPYQPGP